MTNGIYGTNWRMFQTRCHRTTADVQKTMTHGTAGRKECTNSESCDKALVRDQIFPLFFIDIFLGRKPLEKAQVGFFNLIPKYFPPCKIKIKSGQEQGL